MKDRLFHEEQRFRQPWLWVIFALVSIPLVLLLAAGAYQQLVTGKPFGDRPMSDAGLLTLLVAIILVHGGVIALFWFAQLDVDVTRDELLIRFRPFHFKPKRIPLATIIDARARHYSALGEYGGWGIRFGLRGWAYNVSGNEGVQLTLADGKKILIGSQRCGDLEEAIRRGRVDVR